MSVSESPQPAPAAAAEPLQHLDAQSVALLYSTQIEPRLVTLEAERIGAQRTFWMRLGIGGAGVAVIAAVIMAFSTGWGLGIGVFGLVMVGAWAYGPLDAVGKRAKVAVLNAIAEAMHLRFTIAGFDPPGFGRCRELGLLPGYDRHSVEDLFEGTRGTSTFALYDAHLETRQRDSKGRETWSTVFRGSVIRLAFPDEFLGVTVVKRDAGIFNMFQKGGRDMQKIGLVDSRFEKIFEVFGTDQVEARYLVHPVFMEKLLELEKNFQGGKIRCGFIRGDLLICVEGRDRFEIGGMFSTLVSQDRVSKMADDVTTVMSLLDTVLAGPPPAYQAEIARARAEMQAQVPSAPPPANPPIVS